MPMHLSTTQWLLALLAAFSMGVSKAGFAGLGLLHVVAFALIFGARESTGVVLPMLLIGDIGAVLSYRPHARWDSIARMLPPACLGVLAGALLMGRLSDAAFKPLIGTIILALTAMQTARLVRPQAFGEVPHSLAFAWGMGLLAGVTTMLANAAGPIIGLYVLAIGLPKLELVGTSAWFFLILNAFKVPFSIGLGLIHRESLLLNLELAPLVLAGLVAGRWAIHRIPQRTFDLLLLGFAALAALRLIGVF
jgi:uncharacterized membrane protein YfcA